MSDRSDNKGNELRDRLGRIITWRSGSKRAPNKPLQLLQMVANVQRGGPRMVSFATLEPKLRSALLTFGPNRRSVHPEYPFWHLQNDQVWEIVSQGEVALRHGSVNPTAKELRVKQAKGGFIESYFNALSTSPSLQTDVIHDILDSHFPTSIHEDIVSFFGLSLVPSGDVPPQTDADFRNEVLSAYDGVCSLTNFSVKLEQSILAVEPAMILWPQAGGRNVVTNAIAMTPLHRKLFHLGVFSVDEHYRVRVSGAVKGNNGFAELVGQFEGRKIILPANTAQFPDQDALCWHREEVFRH
jgi:putative restriction endonuclease